MPKVSIIIPVYNAEGFIGVTIESLLNQTLTDCEYIFVNDGSTDNSLEVLQRYAVKDTRIVVIDQANQGISIARNSGVNISTGEYIGFMDNDDYVKPDMFETLYNDAVANNADIIVSKTILGRDGKYIIKDSIFPAGLVYDNAFIQDNIITNLLKAEDLFAVWNKLYKRSHIDEFNVRFPKNRNIEEDSMFNFQAFNKASRVIFTEYSGYYYKDVVVNESRKLIERDYFARAIERYLFDYKKEVGLVTKDEDIARLTAIRLIHRVFYLFFKCALDGFAGKKTRYNYIKNMITNPLVRNVAAKYNTHTLGINGYFERVVFFIIKSQAIIIMGVVIKMLQLFYTPKLSEFLRTLNKTKTGEQQNVIKKNI